MDDENNGKISEVMTVDEIDMLIEITKQVEGHTICARDAAVADTRINTTFRDEVR